MIKYGKIKCEKVIHLESPYDKPGIFCKVVRDFDTDSYSTTRFRLEVTCKNCIRRIEKDDIEWILKHREKELQGMHNDKARSK